MIQLLQYESQRGSAAPEQVNCVSVITATPTHHTVWKTEAYFNDGLGVALREVINPLFQSYFGSRFLTWLIRELAN